MTPHGMTPHGMTTTRRGAIFGAGTVAALITAVPWLAHAATTDDAAATAPVQQLNAALLSAMKAGPRTPFADRYRTLAPVIEQVFDLDGVLARSVGVSWDSIPAPQKEVLAKAFRRYTISSYLANFDSYNGQNFQVAPETRQAGDSQVVVQSQLVRADGSHVQMDYVVSRGRGAWKVVDVLLNGAISRVAVQRSDFRALLRSGGVEALASSLENKVASLSGGMAT